jgi:hypothetical protein
LQQRLTGHTAFLQRFPENPPELPLKQTVLITQLLFFTERDRLIGLFAPRPSRAMHARRIIFPLQRFRRAE